MSGCGAGGAPGPDDGNSFSTPLASGFPLTVELDGSGTVSTASGGIDCRGLGTPCNAVYTSGASVTLLAAPAEEYSFDGWGGDAIHCARNVSCTLSMTAARSVRAVFARTRYGLTISVNGSGTVASTPAGIACGSDCSENYVSGTSVTLNAAAAAGYTFAGWSGSGVSCPGTGACTVPMTATRSVAATFSPIAASSYLLQVNRAGSGTVTSAPAGINCGADCSENYNSGTAVTLSAAPASGFTFSGWSGGGCSGTGNCTVSMTAARTTTATFAPLTYVLAVSVTGSGSVTSSPAGINCGTDCSESYTGGTSVTLTATPASGYAFSGWGGACAAAGTGSCAVAMTAARNVTATFTANSATSTYTVSWDAVADARATGYKLYYSTTPLTSGASPLTVNVGNVTTYTFDPAANGISAGATVYFAVAATGSGSESALSDAVNILIQ